MRLRKVPGGYLPDPDGELTVPVWRFIFHPHLGAWIFNPQKVLRVPVSRDEYPPFPCATDLIHRLTKEKLKEAYEMWVTSGKQAVCAVFDLPNHGCHLLFFWTVNEQGIIPENPAEQMKEVFEKRYLLPIFEVEQR